MGTARINQVAQSQDPVRLLGRQAHYSLCKRLKAQIVIAGLLISTILSPSKAPAASAAAVSNDSTTISIPGRWPADKARLWYEQQPWLVGCNFIPSTAINQLEMWQADTFDTATIDQELGYAAKLGFSSVRVFLHNIPWQNDRVGFLTRIDKFLGIANKHDIGVMFVLFDSVWDPFPKAGPQPAPRPHVMGSAWVQAPGADILKDPAAQDKLHDYVVGILTRFKDDPRVDCWDLMNEPDNPVPQYSKVELPDKAEAALVLLKKTFHWARSVNPSQPLTSGVWQGDWSDPAALSAMAKFQLNNSDIITFHSYAPLPEVKRRVQSLQRYDRPVLCTEYMARPLGSTFNPIMGYFAENRIGAYNWGLVLGKTQTAYPWDSWEKSYSKEPAVWFHDILRPDGTPFDETEVRYIKTVTHDAKTSSGARRR